MSRQSIIIIGIAAASILIAGTFAVYANSQKRQTTASTSSPSTVNQSGNGAANGTGAIIQPPQPQPKGLRIAFVRQNFTYAAYQLGSFYNFYYKYDPLYEKNKASLPSNITADSGMLNEIPLTSGNFYLWYQNPAHDKPGIIQNDYITMVYQHAVKAAPSPLIAKDIITDVDVHNGKIFNASDPTGNTNAYDILFLFHQEYVTDQEYHNLERFVANGGTIVFNDANVFYVEVSYDAPKHSITFVRGHYWAYNGKTVWHDSRGHGERWYDENPKWLGSNFLPDPVSANVTFTNPHFNYTHQEEQYVSNKNATMLLDFGAVEPLRESGTIHPLVGVYKMDYGKGHIINLGIYAHSLVNNTQFLDYYDKTILPMAYHDAEQQK